MDKSTIILVDENDNEKEYKIFFTYEEPESQNKYVFYYDDEVDENEDPIYYVSRYDDDQNIYELDAEEQEIAEEVFNTFIEENEFEIVD